MPLIRTPEQWQQLAEVLQRQAIRHQAQTVEKLSAQVEEVILTIETGPMRDLLSEANIHLHAARQKLRLVQQEG